MTLGQGCAVAVAVFFVIFGGCTFLIATPGTDDTPFAIAGLVLVIAGIGIIAGVVSRVSRVRRARAP